MEYFFPLSTDKLLSFSFIQQHLKGFFCLDIRVTKLTQKNSCFFLFGSQGQTMDIFFWMMPKAKLLKQKSARLYFQS